MTESLASLLAQAWALSETSRSGTANRKVARQGRRNQRRTGTGLGGMSPMNKTDLKIKPPSWTNVPSTVPKMVTNLIAWDTVKINSTITGTSSIVETNFTASLSQHPQASSWTTLFDQWSIPQFTVEFDSQVPNGSTSIPVALYTAIDFDNSSNLGSIPVIEDYSTCEVKVQTAGGRTMRSVRPCNKVQVSVSGGGVSTSGVTGPTWQDSGQTTTVFYGIRSILAASNSCVINVTQTIWYCFRNQI